MLPICGTRLYCTHRVGMGSGSSHIKKPATTASKRLYRNPEAILEDVSSLVGDACDIMLTLPRVAVMRGGSAHHLAPTLLSELLQRLVLIHNNMNQETNIEMRDPCIHVMVSQILYAVWFSLCHKYMVVIEDLVANIDPQTEKSPAEVFAQKPIEAAPWCKHNSLHQRAALILHATLEMASIVSDCKSHEEFSLVANSISYSMLRTSIHQRELLKRRIARVAPEHRQDSDIEFTLGMCAILADVQELVASYKPDPELPKIHPEKNLSLSAPGSPSASRHNPKSKPQSPSDAQPQLAHRKSTNDVIVIRKRDRSSSSMSLSTSTSMSSAHSRSASLSSLSTHLPPVREELNTQ